MLYEEFMMDFAQSKKNVQIKNMLPKSHEISSVSGKIILKKDEDFDIFCFDTNFDGFLSTRVRLWPMNSPCTLPTTPDPESNDSVMIVNSNFLFQLKKMIQIMCCSCTQRKFRSEGIDFYTEKRFYDNIEKIYVVPYPRHPYFKERIGSRFVNISCNRLNLEKGRCNNCKVICFNLNF